MEIEKNTSATLVVTVGRSFADARTMVYPSTGSACAAVVTMPAAGFGATAGVALLPTSHGLRHTDPSHLGTRSWSPPV